MNLSNYLKPWICYVSKSKIPLVTTVRYKKPNTKKPVKFFDRELALALTAPEYPNPFSPLIHRCSRPAFIKRTEEQTLHPFFQFIAKEVHDEIVAAKVVAIFHAHPHKPSHLYDMRLEFDKINMKYLYQRLDIIRLALQDTKYITLLKLFEVKSHLFLSNQDVDIKKLLNMVKKLPYITLIGGLYDGQIVTVSDFQRLATLPELDGLHSELSGLLQAPTMALSSTLSRNQSDLSAALDRYSNPQSEVTPDENAPTETPPENTPV